MSQLDILHKNPEELFILTPDSSEVRICYGLISGLGEPYKGGEYIFQLIMHDDYPDVPPRLIFLSATGVFIPGHVVCISVGEFHADDKPGAQGSKGWRKAMGLRGFSCEVVNALICSDDLGTGIGIDHKSSFEKRLLALQSRASNEKQYPEIMAEFNQHIESYPESVAVKNIVAARAPRAADSAPPPPADSAPPPPADSAPPPADSAPRAADSAPPPADSAPPPADSAPPPADSAPPPLDELEQIIAAMRV
jgi:ubiquitin-protein ligase